MAIDLFGANLSDAIFSRCTSDTCRRGEFCEDPVHRPWRYGLRRTWDQQLPLVCFIMLNPSTAGREVDDPAIRRCGGFAKRWGYGGFEVGNLYALRSTEPSHLTSHPDPVGPENDRHIEAIVKRCAVTVVAWGARRMANGRAAEVLGMLTDFNIAPRCLDRTKHGKPKHPLYVSYGAHQPYREA